MARPYRKIDLATFTGDAWAVDATGALAPPELRLVVKSLPLRWRVIPVDGGGDGAAQVTDATTIDARRQTITVGPQRQDEFTLDAPVSFTTGGEVPLPAHFAEYDMKAGDRVALGIPTITIDTAAFLFVYVEGAVLEQELGA